MSSCSILLKFHGRDFTRIADDLEEEVVLSEERRPLNKEEQIRLITKFVDSQKDNIDKLLIDSGKKCPKTKDKKEIYSLFNDEYWWSGLVGIINGQLPVVYESDLRDIDSETEPNTEYKNVSISIQIQSRFDVNVEGKRAKPYFLSTMLMKCKSGVNDQLVPNNSDDYFFDLLLLYLFKEKANKCFLKGLYKTYQRFERNDDKLKGAIDVSRHIRLNMGLENGKIAYSYRENTVDNYLNHLIICAFEKMKLKYPESLMAVYSDSSNANFKLFIESIRSKINYPCYDARTLISKNANAISHPFYTEYEELRKVSLKILRDEGVSMFDGNSGDVNGILFYIPDLWELYLEQLLIDNNYKLYTQGLNGKPIKVFNHENAEFKQKTYPDYVFKLYSEDLDNKPFMILDAKFKPQWAEIIDKDKPLSSELGDYDKCIRDMNSINAHACGTIFPTNIDMTDKLTRVVKHDISDFNKIDKFFTFPIIIPYSTNDGLSGYTKWYNEFYTKNRDTIGLIKKCVLEEQDFTIKNMGLLKQLNALRIV